LGKLSVEAFRGSSVSPNAVDLPLTLSPGRNVGKHIAALRELTSDVTLTRVQHPSGIPEKIVNKVVTRRGRLHAFETVNPQSTALVVIDLDAATVPGDSAAKAMIPTVNRLALAIRRGGGVVAWVRSRMDKMPRHFAAILGEELAAKYFNDGHGGGPGTALWHELHSEPTDVFAYKSGASAFSRQVRSERTTRLETH
jgi:hypothetical protein